MIQNDWSDCERYRIDHSNIIDLFETFDHREFATTTNKSLSFIWINWFWIGVFVNGKMKNYVIKIAIKLRTHDTWTQVNIPYNSLPSHPFNIHS